MKGINTGTSDFADLITNDAIYVDKTAYMHRLASDTNNKVVFMSRPRRFGKSLTVSAFKALFTGRRELFNGLAIERLGWKWQTHPVIHFRFNELRTESVAAFEADFVSYVGKQLRDAGHEYDASVSYAQNFSNAIEALYAKSLEAYAAKFNASRGGGTQFSVSEAVPAALAKAEGWYRHQIVLRAPAAKDIVAAVKWIESARPVPKEVRLAVDIDAQNLA
jgi:hypothetical protein